MLKTKTNLRLSFFFLLLISCEEKGGKDPIVDHQNEVEDPLAQIQNPVLPGDFADPSVVRVGDDYWATATSSEWAPLFPLLHSKNLEEWEMVGHVFPDNSPSWAEAHFWAPEIAYDNGKYYIYYTAKKKDGPLCVGVASATNAKGPYRDHGPLICQEAGSIDGFQIRDDEGKLYLIWKEDGNSRGEPTPTWGQQMNEARTELLGEKFELFRNDPKTWEGNLVEGAYLVKKKDYYYAFYSGDACCGRGCTYGVGVARAKDLRGPWEKYEKNPLIREDADWKCKGHGSLVTTPGGRYFFLYHAYNKEGTVYTGRQGLLSEIIWKENGWPQFKEDDTPEVDEQTPQNLDVVESFEGQQLGHQWQWPVGNKPKYSLEGGKLRLNPQDQKIGAVLARRTLQPNYSATTAVTSQVNSGDRGLAVIGDEDNALGISYASDQVFVWKVEQGRREVIATAPALVGEQVYLKIKANQGEEYSFSWSDDGESWKGFPEEVVLLGRYLPPWDRAVRIGLVNKGMSGADGLFESVEIDYLNE